MNKMNIGVLTHSISKNYGANLQAISTGYYLRNHGYNPIFFNWITEKKPVQNNAQNNLHDNFISAHGFILSKPCIEDNDFLDVIKEYDIKNIIVGSDCVLVVEDRYLIPYVLTKRGFVRRKKKSDHVITYSFPNAFWLPFLNGNNDVRRFLMSGSCGTSDYKSLENSTLIEMKQLLEKFDYISARDNRTADMVARILGNNKTVPVTPDPVFGFNSNLLELPSRESIKKKFNLPEKYIVFSFYRGLWPNQQWVDKIRDYAHDKRYKTISLLMPQGGVRPKFDINIELPLDPIDWYSILRYSDGYVGNNMHPIIVCIHNCVPFYSINHHAQKIFFRKFDTARNTKEVDLLRSGDLMDFHTTQLRYKYHTPESIIEKLIKFDRESCKKVSEKKLEDYNAMMGYIISQFK